MIPFNIPPYMGKEKNYIADAIGKHRISGDGEYTKKCNHWIEERTGCGKALLSVC